MEDIAVLLSRPDKCVTSVEVERACSTLDDRLRAADVTAKRPRSFLIRARLIPETVVRGLAARLTWAFHPWMAGLVAAFTLAALVPAVLLSKAPTLYGSSVLWAYLILLASMLIHELGHAAACQRFGAAPSDIGFALYLIFPSFYSDVTSAWELSRGKRVVVDLGGMYFQFACAAVCALGYFVVAWPPLLLGMWMNIGTCLYSLNPIFKFDGYWALADALGVTNLDRQPARLRARLWERLRGRGGTQQPFPAAVSWSLAIYGVASASFMVFVLAKMIPYVARKCAQYPELVSAACHWPPPWKAVGILAFNTLVITLPLLLMGRMLLPVLKATLRRLLRRSQTGPQHHNGENAHG